MRVRTSGDSSDLDDVTEKKKKNKFHWNDIEQEQAALRLASLDLRSNIWMKVNYFVSFVRGRYLMRGE